MKLPLLKKVFAVMFICSFVLAPVSQKFETQQAEAVFGVGDTVIEIGGNLFTNILNTVRATSEWLKSFGLDGILWALTNRVLEEMINSTTDWVTSGFDGDPAFITDFEGFLLETVDIAAGEFLLMDGPLEFLCSPFKLDVLLAIDLQYRGRGPYYKPQCSISEVGENFEEFVDGDFSKGGWQRWAQVSLRPSGSAYGSVFSGSAEFDAHVDGARGTNQDLVRMGGGFFSKQTCEDTNGDGKFGTGECIVDTPGVVIEGVLNDALDIPNKRLTVADELDELVGALLVQFVNKALDFGGTGTGLRGFGASDYGSTVVPEVPDTKLEIEYIKVKEEVMSLILQTQTYCEIEHKSGLPIPIEELYSDLQYDGADGNLHDEEDIRELQELHAALEPALAKYRNNKCRGTNSDIWLEFSVSTSTPSSSDSSTDLESLYDPDMFEPTDVFDPDLEPLIDVYGDELGDVYEPTYETNYSPYSPPGGYSNPGGGGNNEEDPFEEEKAACALEEDTMMWDYRCDECVSQELRPGDICDWENQQIGYDCDDMSGSCPGYCESIDGIYEDGQCMFTRHETEDRVVYCDFASTNPRTKEDCLAHCDARFRSMPYFQDYIVDPKSQIENIAGSEYFRQWCWASYKKYDEE